jgi:transcriptional antiterminator NusG
VSQLQGRFYVVESLDVTYGKDAVVLERDEDRDRESEEMEEGAAPPQEHAAEAGAGDAESLFFDLPEDDVAEAEDASEASAAADADAGEAPVAEPAPAGAEDGEAATGEASTVDDLLSEVEIELTADEKADLERRSRMQWFVVHANTGHENKVKRNIEMAIKSNHMEDQFGDILVATQEVTEMRNGKRSTVKRKFFPSYILVEMIMNKETYHFINSVPGVTRFIGGTPQKPEPITKDEVDRILGRIAEPEEGKETVEIPFHIGESVQVTDGPFTDWIGVINAINHDKGKLKVMISIFGKETPVELDFLQVKPI